MSTWLDSNNSYEIFTMKCNHACVTADFSGSQGLGLPFSFYEGKEITFIFSSLPEDQFHMYLTASQTSPPCGHQSDVANLQGDSDHMTALCFKRVVGPLPGRILNKIKTQDVTGEMEPVNKGAHPFGGQAHHLRIVNIFAGSLLLCLFLCHT